MTVTTKMDGNHLKFQSGSSQFKIAGDALIGVKISRTPKGDEYYITPYFKKIDYNSKGETSYKLNKPNEVILPANYKQYDMKNGWFFRNERELETMVESSEGKTWVTFENGVKVCLEVSDYE